jgi:dihydroorotate dehydrogenase electron transfer subunit
MNDVQAQVRDNRQVAQGAYLMAVECSLPPSIPGQFVMVKITSGRELFLRRPLAILSHDGSVLEILYKVKGQGTAELSRSRPGDVLWFLGPLGNGFSLPREDDEVVFVAGGTGLPPIMSLASQVGRGSLVIGARSKADIPLMERMQAIPGITVLPVTEDGSLGERGLATDVLARLLGRAGRAHVVYACGPHGMLKKVYELSREKSARCEVSLEEYMACGFGVCSACAVKTTEGSQRVCCQGPVFDAGIIQWSP